MTTSEPTTGEIVRALRDCFERSNVNGICMKCEFTGTNGKYAIDPDECGYGCETNLAKHAIDRLESQECEIEELKSEAIVNALENAERIANLTARAEQAEKERDEVISDLVLLAGDTNSAIKCGMCKYNPNDMGCELDGSQFDDDGECHFEWRGLPQDGEGKENG